MKNKHDNIAEYILYLWQLEDYLRAFPEQAYQSKELMEISHGGERGSTKEDARAAAAEWIKNLKAAGLHGRVFIDSFATVLFYPDDLSMDTRRKAAVAG